MNGEQRRQEILHLLKTQGIPLSGSLLANLLNVSRQVIVQDIALLKASDHVILSTNRGYVLFEPQDQQKQRVLRVRHSTEEISDELYTIVDAGGYILDVFVRHMVYGEIKAPLSLRTRSDVDGFMKQLSLGQVQPLKLLTDDFHYHTVIAESDQMLDAIEQRLLEKGYLVTD